jgi:folate-binding protein YgfZ
MTSYEALRSRAAFIDYSSRGKIRVTGEDRARFLHAMSTNHVSGLQPGHGLYAFFLTAQGRIIADACIYHLGDSFLLDTEAELTSKLTEHLDRFVIADDVELHNESELWSAAGLEGPESLQLASALGVPIPEQSLGVSNWGDGFVARTSATGPIGLRLFVPRSEFQHLREKFAELGIPEASASDVDVVRLENGIARYGVDFGERYLVGETGLMHGVHNNKGCYVGQEIVERVRSRAQLHRQLRPLRIGGSVVPAAGAKLLRDGKDAGEITSAAFSPALDVVVALGYVRTEALAGETPLSVAGLHPPAAVSILPNPPAS